MLSMPIFETWVLIASFWRFNTADYENALSGAAIATWVALGCARCTGLSLIIQAACALLPALCSGVVLPKRFDLENRQVVRKLLGTWHNGINAMTCNLNRLVPQRCRCSVVPIRFIDRAGLEIRYCNAPPGPSCPARPHAWHHPA